MTLELEIELEVVNTAERHGWIARKVQWIGRRGAPDRLFFGHGRCVLIEFKRPGEVVKGQQGKEFRRLRAVYPEVYCCDSVAEALRILEIG